MSDQKVIMPSTETGIIAKTGRMYTFETTGVEVELEEINPMVINSFQLEGRPKRPPIPMDVSTVNGETMLTPNPKHPDYLFAIDDFEKREEEYKMEQMLVSMRYAFVNGIKDSPPDEFVTRHKRFMYDDHQLKYSWVFSQFADMDDALECLNVILGQTSVTEEGINESQERFPATGDGAGSDVSGQSVPDEQGADRASGDAASDGGA